MSFVKRNYIDGETVITAENLNDIQDAIIQIVPDDVKQALLQIASKVAYIDEHGQDYYDALESALYPDATLVSITAVYTQSGTVYDTDSLDSLKADLVVTALYSDATTATVTAYTLSGTLTAGTSTITVTYSGKTTTFDVTVSQRTIRVFKGKGTSGTSIVDNANRALSELFPLSFAEPVSIQFPERANNTYTFAFKFANGENAITTLGGTLLPQSYIGTNTQTSFYSGFAETSEKLYEAVYGIGQWEYVSNNTSGVGDGNIRFLFKNVTDAASPISETIDDVVYINDIPYHFVESDVSDFE